MFCHPSSLWGTSSASCKSKAFGVPKDPTPKKCVLPEDLDLECVRKNLAKKEGWQNKRIRSAEKAYLEFLTLLLRHPKEGIVPWSKNLDTFWHYHILDTQKYATDCDSVFGYYLHHDPHVRNKAKHRAAVKKTLQLRRQLW